MNETETKRNVGSQYVTIAVGGEVFGLPIEQIEGIVPWEPLTHVPRMPAFIAGVVCIRGSVLAVMDLRMRLGMETVEHMSTSRILLVQVDGTRFGLIVDQVREVVWVSPDRVASDVSVVSTIGDEFLEGIARLEGGLALLLKTESLVAGHEKRAIEKAERQAASKAA